MFFFKNKNNSSFTLTLRQKLRVNRVSSFTLTLRQKLRVNRVSSFTLIELLIVIGILAVLMVAVVVVLNPAEYLRDSRDSKRLTDLSSLHNALQTLEALSASALSLGTPLTVYISIADEASSTCGSLGLPALPTGYVYHCVTSANLKNTDGTGWIPVNFQDASGVIQISALPIDPVNSTTTSNYYTYIPGGSYELSTIFESTKYRLSGDKDKVSVDGGDNYSMYEVGSNLSLNPLKDTGLVGWWKFDSSGSISNNQTLGLEDFSGIGNNGTAVNTNGTGMSFVQGKVGNAVQFDGVDDYVELPNPGGSQMSMSFWAKEDFSNLRRNIQKNTPAGSDGFVARFSSNEFGIYLGTGTPSAGYHYTSGGNITQGNYKHIVWTYDKVTLLIYVDGVKRKEIGVSRSTNFSSNPVNFGLQYGVGEGYKGDVDDIRIYNRILTASEIMNLYNATR